MHNYCISCALVIIRGAPDSDFYYPAGYRICRIFKKNPTGLSGRIPDILQFEYLTYNIYYKDFSHPCILVQKKVTLFFLNFLVNNQ
jgi:hypothetical protein